METKPKKCPVCNKRLKWDMYEGRFECIKQGKDRREGCGYVNDPKDESQVDIVTYEVKNDI